MPIAGPIDDGSCEDVPFKSRALGTWFYCCLNISKSWLLHILDFALERHQTKNYQNITRAISRFLELFRQFSQGCALMWMDDGWATSAVKNRFAWRDKSSRVILIFTLPAEIASIIYVPNESARLCSRAIGDWRGEPNRTRYARNGREARIPYYAWRRVRMRFCFRALL